MTATPKLRRARADLIAGVVGDFEVVKLTDLGAVPNSDTLRLRDKPGSRGRTVEVERLGPTGWHPLVSVDVTGRTMGRSRIMHVLDTVGPVLGYTVEELNR